MICHAILAFLGMLAADYLWARYTIHIAFTRPVRAANFAAAVFVVLGFVTVLYVNDYWMLIPAAAGAWCGTYIGTRS